MEFLFVHFFAQLLHFRWQLDLLQCSEVGLKADRHGEGNCVGAATSGELLPQGGERTNFVALPAALYLPFPP